MPDSGTPGTKPLPFRQLVWPDVEEASDRPTEGTERRRYRRYSQRRMPATIITGSAEHPAECVDIGYGGLQLVSELPIDLLGGQRIRVRITQMGTVFQDECTVVRVIHRADGVCIHLCF